MPVPGALGRRKPDPAHAARSLRIGTYLTYRARNMVPPPAVDHFTKVKDWGLYGNDNYSDCGPVTAANLRKMVTLYVTGTEVSPSQDDVFALYKLQNPDFDPNDPGGPGDGGVDLQTMCEDLVKHGIGGVKALGFASVDVSNPTELRECVTLFGGLILGVNLETAQQNQTSAGIWTYDPTAEWGRHAVLHAKYSSNPDAAEVITWAEDVILTDSFEQNQLEEAWVVIWPENLKIGAFSTGLDRNALAADYKALTGKDFPMGTPPEPLIVTPPPDPAPVPDPAPAPGPVMPTAFADLEAMVARMVKEAEDRGRQMAQEAMAEGRGIVDDLKGKVAEVDNWLKSHGL